MDTLQYRMKVWCAMIFKMCNLDTDVGISLIASDLIISCQTEKVKQHGGCAELCASLFRKKGEKMNTTKKIINRIVVCGAMIAIGINTYDL